MKEIAPEVKAELIKTARKMAKHADRQTGPYANKSEIELFKHFYHELVSVVEEKTQTDPKLLKY